MATNVGEAVIKLSFDDKGSTAQLQNAFKNIGGVAKSSAKMIGAGIAAASTAVAGLTTLSVKSYAEFEQLQGGIETLFKDSSDELMNYASQAYKTAQISANDYMETATSFSASLIQGLGGDTKKAADYANRAIISMSDNANKMGTDIQRIQDAYRGFARGQFNMLDNLALGYGGTRTEMERLIKDAAGMNEEMQKLGVTVDANSMSFDNIVNAIAVVQEHMGIAGTSAQEAANTISGSFNMMKASIQDLVTGFTNPNADLDKLFENTANSVMAFGENLIPAIESALKGITKFIEKALPKVLEVIPNLLKKLLPGIIETGVKLFGMIFEQIPTLTQTLIDTIFGVVNQLLPQLPALLQSVLNGIIGFFLTITKPENMQKMLAASYQFLSAIVQALPQIIIALINALPELITNIIDYLTDPNTILMIIAGAVQLFMGIVQAIPQILGALFQAFANLFGLLWERLQGLFSDFVGKFGETIKGIFVRAINGVLQFIENFLNGPIDLINGFIDTINSTFGSIGVNIGKVGRINLPRLAQGGITTGPTTALIGEAGKEAVIPLEQNTENWTRPLAKALAEQFEQEGISTAGHITVNMNNYINNNLDADEIGQRLMTSIRRAA